MTKEIKLVLLSSVVLLIVFLGFKSLTSRSNVLGVNSEVKVTHVAGKIEKLKEKATLIFKFGELNKAKYYEYLAEKRLAELIYVIESDRIDSVEETASRYSTYIGTLTNYVVENKATGIKDELNSMFDRHSSVIIELQKKFKFETAWWLVLQHDINTISILKEKVVGL